MDPVGYGHPGTLEFRVRDEGLEALSSRSENPYVITCGHLLGLWVLGFRASLARAR